MQMERKPTTRLMSSKTGCGPEGIKKANDIYNLTNDTSSQVYLTEEQMKNKWQNEYEYYFESSLHFW